MLATAAFVAFGVTDLLEIGHGGVIPLWLWAFKIACGCGILAARYTWHGWNTFRWRDREFLFGIGCLVAVGVVITVQQVLGQLPGIAQQALLGTSGLDNPSPEGPVSAPSPELILPRQTCVDGSAP